MHVNYSRVLRVSAFAAILGLTLALKFAVYDQTERPTENDLDRAIQQWLAGQNYSVGPGAFNHGFLGVTADCQIHVEDVAANQENAQAIRVRQPDNARAFFVYRGEVLADQPWLRGRIDTIWRRIRWRLGFSADWTPLLAVWATGPCAAERLPWAELAKIDHRP